MNTSKQLANLNLIGTVDAKRILRSVLATEAAPILRTAAGVASCVVDVDMPFPRVSGGQRTSSGIRVLPGQKTIIHIDPGLSGFVAGLIIAGDDLGPVKCTLRWGDAESYHVLDWGQRDELGNVNPNATQISRGSAVLSMKIAFELEIDQTKIETLGMLLGYAIIWG